MSASVSGLASAHRIQARDLAVRAAVLALHNEPAIHYTQGGRRWDGIRLNLKAYLGEFPHYADCSAFVAWCIWNGLDHFGVRDTVNGEHWLGGFTGTMLDHGKEVRHRENVQRADAVIYGNGGNGEHTALCIGGGMVISHGSERAPLKLPIDYRDDIMCIRRYI